MVDPGRALGGYSPEAGRNDHEADAPTRVPVPSLLRSLLSDHLDPGYAAAAAERREGGPRGRAWEVDVAGAGRARRGHRVRRRGRAGPVRGDRPPGKPSRCWRAVSESAEATADEVTARRNALTAEVDAERRSRLEGDARGQQLLDSLDEAEHRGGRHRGDRPGPDGDGHRPRGVEGPVRRVQATGARAASRSILDRDLQLVVNSLWVSGAEAVSVGGVRIGPERDDPAGGRRHPGRQSADQQPIRHSRDRTAARHAGRLRPQSRLCSVSGCWRRPTASGSRSAPATA